MPVDWCTVMWMTGLSEYFMAPHWTFCLKIYIINILKDCRVIRTADCISNENHNYMIRYMEQIWACLLLKPFLRSGVVCNSLCRKEWILYDLGLNQKVPWGIFKTNRISRAQPENLLYSRGLFTFIVTHRYSVFLWTPNMH